MHPPPTLMYNTNTIYMYNPALVFLCLSKGACHLYQERESSFAVLLSTGCTAVQMMC